VPLRNATGPFRLSVHARPALRAGRATKSSTRRQYLVLGRIRSSIVGALVAAAIVLRPGRGAAEEGANPTTNQPVAIQWNPLAAGPQLLSSPGVQVAGQMFVRVYGFSEFGYAQYGGSWSIGTQPLNRKLLSLNPQVEFSYGLVAWLEAGVYASEASWWQTSGANTGAASGNGIGDTTAYVKLRLHVQRPDDGLPWIANMFFAALPTSDWAGSAGTPPIPGGFAPLGRLPATHFGRPELTDALLFRKNVRPFRFAGGVYYSYAPGDTHYFGDLVQYRLSFEHFLDDKKGFAYAIEAIGLHGLPFRLDGHAVNSGTRSFGLMGVGPTVEYNLTEHLIGAFGVLFTALGTDDIAAIYPNVSLYYYWNPSGPVVAR
jgi:hypothetical protein